MKNGYKSWRKSSVTVVRNEMEIFHFIYRPQWSKIQALVPFKQRLIPFNVAEECMNRSGIEKILVWPKPTHTHRVRPPNDHAQDTRLGFHFYQSSGKYANNFRMKFPELNCASMRENFFPHQPFAKNKQ